MNWIRPVKRLSIYLRDGLACCWCGATIEDGAQLTLDHCTPRSRGGSNEAGNLITACSRCNSSRGTRSLRAFAAAVATYLDHGIDPAAILAHVQTSRRRNLDLSAAEDLMSRRGGFTAALKG